MCKVEHCLEYEKYNQNECERQNEEEGVKTALIILWKGVSWHHICHT